MLEGNQPVSRKLPCELELLLRASAQGDQTCSYYPFVRFFRPDANSESRISNAPRIVIDQKRLNACKAEPLEYGKALWSMLFGSTEMQRVLEIANANADALRTALRLRLLIGHDALELHSVWWEALVDPRADSPILMRERFMFSRYLDSAEDAPLESLGARKLRVLYAVSNPGDLDEWPVNGRSLGKPDVHSQFLPDDVASQFDIARLGDGVPCTLNNLVAQLREGVDILYLVCHGALVEGQSRLYLENDSGLTEVVSGDRLANRLRDMTVRPSMVILASCQSAGTGAAASIGDDGELAALGPRLMDAGVAAVIAMQGNVTQRTARQFMPALFEHLAAHGQVEYAMAVARGTVRDHHDWWMPVLYTRLKNGALWDETALTVPDRFKWGRLLADLQKQETVMVLGSSLGEDVLGASRDIARDWMNKCKYPRDPSDVHTRDGLQQVTQFVACTYNRNFALAQLRRYLLLSLRERYAEVLADYQDETGAPDELDALVREIGARLRAQIQARRKAGVAGVTDLAYTQIARLPVTTYVTTNRDNLLFDSLVAEGRRPEIVICRWKPLATGPDTSELYAWPASVFDRQPDFKPSIERPLIYHVFGNLSHPHTMVLTEDDYFDFLVGFSRNQSSPRTSMPAHVRMVLATHGLMFLGFQFDDWEFRALFRGVLPREGIEAGADRLNVAVQLDPDDRFVPSADAARAYMQTYFSQHRMIHVYFARFDEFLHKLTGRWAWTKP